jgi:hypothetical protein
VVSGGNAGDKVTRVKERANAFSRPAGHLRTHG